MSKITKGSLHPITLVKRELEALFLGLGYEIAEGPTVETEEYNFDLLNIPKDHPARDMWDTFWLKAKGSRGERLLMRTHTSPVQIRYALKHKPPIRIISPGRVFRYEAEDSTHASDFWQFEGLVIDKDISVGHLKATIDELVKTLFGRETEIRLRPSYFPFTEPSFEVDMKRRGGDWLEMAGCGMVHPRVLKNMGLDPKKYSGFAFGFGIDRLVMMKYGIEDIRHFLNSDLRFTRQFS